MGRIGWSHHAARLGTASGDRPDWLATHAKDLNGDGKSDIVLRNTVDGRISVRLMNGLSVLEGSEIYARQRRLRLPDHRFDSEPCTLGQGVDLR